MSLNILYLDDEQDICELFVDLFQSKEINIDTFVDPEKAIKAAQINNYDLVFLDYRLSDSNGIEVGRKLCPKTPKVLITGDTSVITENEFILIINKPFNIGEVEAFIKNFDTANKAIA